MSKMLLLFGLLILLLSACTTSSNENDKKFLFEGEGAQEILFLGTFEDKSTVYIGNTMTRSNISNENIHDIDIHYYDQNFKWIKTVQIKGNGDEELIFADVIEEKLYLFFNSKSETVNSSQSLGGEDAIVMIIDKNGEVVDLERFGGSGKDEFLDVRISSNNEWIIVGSSDSNDGDFKSLSGEKNYFVLKLNLQARIVDEKYYNNEVSFNAVRVNSKNEIYLLGKTWDGTTYLFNGSTRRNLDVLILKLDENLSSEYSKLLTTYEDLIIDDVEIDSSDNIIIIGTFGPPYKIDNHQILILKMNSEIELIWDKILPWHYGKSNLNDLMIQKNNSILILYNGINNFKYFNSEVEKTNYIIRFDASGNFIFQIPLLNELVLRNIFENNDGFDILGIIKIENDNYDWNFDIYEGIIIFVDKNFMPKLKDQEYLFANLG